MSPCATCSHPVEAHYAPHGPCGVCLTEDETHAHHPYTEETA